LTTQDIYAGEQVTLRRFANHEEQGVRSQLHGPIRAVSIPGTPDALLTGTLKDGDHVDLIANLKNPNGQFVVRDVVRDLLVLHAGAQSTTQKVQNGGTTANSVLLAVSDNREAQKIWFTVENASGWSLMLRPVAGATTPPLDLEVAKSVVEDGASSTQVAKSEAAR
jgi:Flp pilus assembly protein CpaB